MEDEVRVGSDVEWSGVVCSVVCESRSVDVCEWHEWVLYCGGGAQRP